MPPTSASASNPHLTAGTDGYLVTRSGQRLPRAPFMKSDPFPFPFFKLPPEIRNMIYRYALAQGAISSTCGHESGSVPIVNMNPGYYKNHGKRKRFRSRTSYKAMIDRRCSCDCPGHWESNITTYTLARYSKVPSAGLLTVSKQVSKELISIFYGENTMLFYDMAAIAPFLKDRSAVARQHIRSIGLVLELYYDDHHHLERQAEWIKAFRCISRHLKLSKLSIHVCDDTRRWWDPIKTSGPKNAWLRALTEINNLEKLDFSIDYEGLEAFYQTLIEDIDDEDEMDEEMALAHDWMVDNELGYREWLRERMIKKKQTRLDNWLRGHSCNAECYGIHKGRLTRKPPGLPKSKTRGLWTLPEVDLDALYYQDHPDELHDDYYSFHDGKDVFDGSNLEQTKIVLYEV
ncbi:MAG: hypothetical protein Q9212_002122 [Teloschistes hypoglaucus]